MTTTVNSIVTQGLTTLLSGDVVLAGVTPVTLAQNSTTKTISVGIGALNSVVSVAGQGGSVDFLFNPGGGQSYDAVNGNITFNTYAPNTGTVTDALMVAQNLPNAMAWVGSTDTPPISTVAYNPGAVVIYSSTTFVCLVAQPIGSALPVNGANWQSIGGGGSSGGASITNGGATLGIDGTGRLTYVTTDVPSNVNGIVLTATVPTTTPDGDAGNISLSAENNIQLLAENTVGMGSNGSTVIIDNTGTISLATSDEDTNVNQINITATVPTTTPGVGAGRINITSGAGMTLTTNTGDLNLVNNGEQIGISARTDVNIGSVGGAVNISSVNSVRTTTQNGDFIVNTRSQPTYAGNIILSANGAESFGQGNINIQNNATASLSMATGSSAMTLSSAGATLQMDNLGSLSYTTTDVASNVNGISLTTTVPTVTPGNNAGLINIASGDSLSISSGDTVGNLDIKNPAGTIQVMLGANSWVSVGVPTPSGYAGGAMPFFNTDAPWDEHSGYARGTVVAIGSVTAPTAFYICILGVAPVSPPAVNTAPSVTPANWLPFGGGGGTTGNAMTLSTEPGAVWDPHTGYVVGTVVNQPSPTGIYVCILEVPPAPPPATNTQPSATPTYWTELISTTTAPGSAMVYTTPFNNVLAYPAQSVVPDANGGDYVCIVPTTVPTTGVNPNPSADPTHWNVLGGAVGAMTQKGVWANTILPTGVAPSPLVSYPPGSVVVLPNNPPTGVLYPAWVGTLVAPAGYFPANPQSKVSYATSATDATLINYICIAPPVDLTVPPYTDTTAWFALESFTDVVDGGIYPFNGQQWVNISNTSLTTYPPLNTTSWAYVGGGVQPNDYGYAVGKYQFPPFLSPDGDPIPAVFTTSDSGNAYWLTGVCPQTPLWYQSWTAPIKISASFTIILTNGTINAGTEVIMTVYVGTLPTRTPLAVNSITDFELLTSPGMNYYRTSFTPYSLTNDIVNGIKTTANFEAQIGGWQGRIGTYNPYIAIAVQLDWVSTLGNAQFQVFYNPVIDGVGGDTFTTNTNNGNAYWEFSPFFGNSATNTVFQNF